MQKDEKLLTAKGICKRFYGSVALDHVDFSVNTGEIHALIGENGAGKSTLMKICLGLYRADEGEIYFKGKAVDFKSPNDALKAGISMIHQEISLIPTLDVARNIWLGQEKKYACGAFLSDRQLYEDAAKLLDTLGITMDVHADVAGLTIAQMQLVEIARAVSCDSDLIIMDEPTSALSENEIENLYRIIRMLAQKGKTVIFISHKLNELKAVCQRLTIMRDGKIIETRRMDEISMEEIITKIAGRKMDTLFPKSEAVIGDTILECRNICTASGVNNVSFSLKRGEILGVCGLMGSGRTEIMRAIYGLDALKSGEIYLKGKKVHIRSPKQAIRAGIGMITEDRLRTGVIHALSVRKNMSLPYLYTICRGFAFIKQKLEKKQIGAYMDKLNVKVRTMEQNISDLSGGNQQKIIIGRWLLIRPDILIMDEPTRGIDVKAKADVYALIDSLVKQEMAVIMVSSELPEIIGMSDRILVIRDGTIAGEFARGDADSEKIMHTAFGV